jgi:hypothetical protein
MNELYLAGLGRIGWQGDKRGGILESVCVPGCSYAWELGAKWSLTKIEYHLELMLGAFTGRIARVKNTWVGNA